MRSFFNYTIAETKDRTIAALSSHRFFMRASLLASFSFVWLFVFTHGTEVSGRRGLEDVAVLFALSQIALILITPYAARALKNGVRLSLIGGALLAIASASLFAMAFSVQHPAFLFILGSILFGFYRAVYFAPFALTQETQGFSPVIVSKELFLSLMPAFAGSLLLYGASPSAVMFAAALGIIASLPPLVHLAESSESFSWGYAETFGMLFEPAHARIVFIHILRGIEAAGLYVFWPVLALLVLHGSYVLVGSVLSLSLVAAAAMRGAYKGANAEKLTFSYPFIIVSMWIGRITALTPYGLVFASVYAAVDPSIGEHTDVHGEGQRADNGTYIDEYSALKEISMGLGRLALALFVVGLVGVVSIQVTLLACLVVAATASFIAAYVPRESRSI